MTPIRHKLVGLVVRSKRIGKKPEFDGRVEAAFSAEFCRRKHVAFHIRDIADGTLWHRELGEFQPIDAALQEHSSTAEREGSPS